MINIKNIPLDILHIIYQYGGANVFYLNKYLLLKINELRKQFYDNPIKFYYKLIEWKHRSLISHYIINTSSMTHRRSVKLKNETEEIDISGGIVGYVRDNIVLPYMNFKRKVIPKEFIEDSKNHYRLNNGITFDIYTMWSKDDRLKYYMSLWV